MPRNGSGTYVRTNGVNGGSTTWTSDRDQNAEIRAGRHDTHDQDIADALTSSIAKDGQTSPTANLPMATFRHTGVGNGVNRTDYAALGQVQDSSVLWAGASSGAANVYACSLTPALTTYVDGFRVAFFAHQDNTSTATLNVNSVGAISILSREGFTLVPYTIKTSTVVEVVYKGSAFYIVSQTPIFNGYQAATATGTTQGTARQITSSFFVATTVTAGANDGVILPAAKRGMSIVVCNGGVDTLNVYPASGESIQPFPYTANASRSINSYTGSNACSRIFLAIFDGTWCSCATS